MTREVRLQKELRHVQAMPVTIVTEAMERYLLRQIKQMTLVPIEFHEEEGTVTIYYRKELEAY